jgi:hypothetical protein
MTKFDLNYCVLVRLNHEDIIGTVIIIISKKKGIIVFTYRIGSCFGWVILSCVEMVHVGKNSIPIKKSEREICVTQNNS